MHKLNGLNIISRNHDHSLLQLLAPRTLGERAKEYAFSLFFQYEINDVVKTSFSERMRRRMVVRRLQLIHPSRCTSEEILNPSKDLDGLVRPNASTVLNITVFA